MRRPSAKDHQGAQAVDSMVVGGVAARLRATSHWMIRSARRRPLLRSSSRWRSRAVVAPKGSEPIARKGRSGMR